MAMTGAKNLLVSDNSLSFAVSGRMTKGRINRVKITLNAMDEYDVLFSRVWNLKCKTILEGRGIQVENLVEYFENNTGLATHL